jgi:hypothetical protein
MVVRKRDVNKTIQTAINGSEYIFTEKYISIAPMSPRTAMSARMISKT